MAKVKYRTINFRDESRALIDESNTIIADYQKDGYRLTLRQLYYQLVTRNTIRNEEKAYKKLSALLTDARYAGLVDWDAIEDRVRQPRSQSEWSNLRSIVSAAIHSYRLPRWKGQKNYIELWTEKDAIANVLSPIAEDYHVTLMVNRGYSSASAMREAALRFKRRLIPDEVEYPEGTRGYSEHRQRRLTLLYLGDLDPSGEDMARDIKARFTEFGAPVRVRKIGLTYAQVQQYSPPPNPAKMADPRAEKYIAKYGRSSWEVDALPPRVLKQIIEGEIAKLLNRPLMDAIIAREEEDKELLRVATEDLMQRRRPPPPWVNHDPGFDDEDDEPEEDEDEDIDERGEDEEEDE